ncbi:MAG: GspE/PulE family protein [Gemmatimonadota bacterium]
MVSFEDRDPPATTSSDSQIRKTFLRSRRSVEEGLVSEQEYLHALAEREKMSLLADPPAGFMEPVGETVPRAFMEEFLVVPFTRTAEGRPCVAIARELDPATRRELAAVLGDPLEIVVADKATVLGLVEALYGGRDGLGGIEGVEIEGDAASGGVEASEDARDLANQPPVIRLVNFLIQEAHRKNASDIHLEAMEDELKVRYRVDGTLHDMTHPPKRYQAAILSRIKILADLDITERRRPQDGRLRMRIDGHAVDLRISTVPTLHGESVVIRLLDQETLMFPLEELGFDRPTLDRFTRLVDAPNGIVLVTGPTGSGKTTTLYAALARRNGPEVKIVTIEDPVEYQLAGINQVHVRPDIGRETALQFVGRQYCVVPGQDDLGVLDSSTELSLGLTRTWRLSSANALSLLEGRFAVDNVTDGAVYDQCGLPRPGRTARIELRLR